MSDAPLLGWDGKPLPPLEAVWEYTCGCEYEMKRQYSSRGPVIKGVLLKTCATHSDHVAGPYEYLYRVNELSRVGVAKVKPIFELVEEEEKS